MTREEYLQNVKRIMINKNPYGVYHKKNFDTYASLGEMTPINSDIINDMPNSKIILIEKIYNELIAVQDVTNMTNEEIPFFLYGREIEDNQILFTEFVSASNNRESVEASFNQTMIDNLQEKINRNLNNGLVVCHGHSHPRIGNLHENFSLGDFTSYMQMNQENSVFKNKQVELTGCLVTSTGNINFVYYDNRNNNFYRFINVYVIDNSNNLKPVNCYGLNQQQSRLR